MNTYPKRLIEVDLPIRRISAHARREKSIRHGNISTLHIWWARRPLAACRAVICASLWPDPADPLCPKAFVEKSRKEMLEWTSHKRQNLLSVESCARFEKARKNRELFDDPVQLRGALLDFIADFANWSNSTVPVYLETSRVLTQAAHEALGGAPGTRPLVVDPFAGGGSIPLEALRVGADAFASDLNPVPVLLNKVVLEYIPKYGQRLADEVRKWGEWIKREAEKELAQFYPKDPDGATPIAYLWARTIQCEGPGCGAEVPLLRSLWVAKKTKRSVALHLVPNKKAKRVDFRILVRRKSGWVNEVDPKIEIKNPTFDGLVKRGAATCPCCGYTTAVTSVRRQLKLRRGGAHDARLYCVVSLREGEQGRMYRVPDNRDINAVRRAAAELIARKQAHSGAVSLMPNEGTPAQNSHRSVGSARVYGMDRWEDLFSPRQALSLSVFSRLVRTVRQNFGSGGDDSFEDAMQTLLAFAFDKMADLSNSLCRWEPNAECPRNLFGRQAIPMVWDFAEGAAIGESSGSWAIHINALENALNGLGHDWLRGHVEQADATEHPLPDDSSNIYFTDPPYYDAVPYGEVSDFFYVWLKRNVPTSVRELFEDALTPKVQQAIVWHPDSLEEKRAYETKMGRAMTEGRRILDPRGIGVIVFAHKTTSGWEAQLGAMVEAGWIVTASWPVDTECGSRMNAQGTAALASSVHLVCRPRENADGTLRSDEIGDWRDVLRELPRRIHEWMPRLAEEGVVGADAIFACLGPALEIFSRYSRVEKASGEAVTLKEYLEQVWAAVAKEALTMVFAGADTTGFEPDARLTAMWLWTLNAGRANDEERMSNDDSENTSGGEEEGDTGKSGKARAGFVLEYDAARKIAQGLGAHLDTLENVVEVSGETARLLSVAERARYLFGKEEGKLPSRKKQSPQLDLFKVLEDAETDSEDAFAGSSVSRPGETVLDRIHQSMILFAAGRSEAVKRFLVEDGIGRDQRFWRLAQALSALYPAATDEKRWVDGVLARKKGLGL